jgi:hypothetical protein
VVVYNIKEVPAISQERDFFHEKLDPVVFVPALFTVPGLYANKPL